MYTTVEGLIEKIIDSIRNIPFGTGDSSDNQANVLDGFCAEMKEVINKF